MICHAAKLSLYEYEWQPVVINNNCCYGVLVLLVERTSSATSRAVVRRQALGTGNFGNLGTAYYTLAWNWELGTELASGQR
eukprot:scaffold162925_cov19-Prasinocladus_malaysianus.AAC.1